MKRPSLSSRRLLSLVATAAIGVVAALAFASPASAHFLQIVGIPGGCIGNTGQITWIVTNVRGNPGTITVESTPSGTFEHTTMKLPDGKGQQLKFTETVPGNATLVHLTVHVDWHPYWDDKENPYSGDADFGKSACTVPPPPSPRPSKSVAPSPSASSSAPPAVHTSTPSLPVTGVNAVAIAGAAVVLLGVGSLMLLYTRRRQAPGTK